jgi:hypothetical protein
MNEPNHLICPCQQCGGAIEFSEDAIGQVANCPHCSQETILFTPPPEEALDLQDEPFVTADPQPSKGRRNTIVLLVLVVAALAAGAFVLRSRLSRALPDEVARDTPTNQHTATGELSGPQTHSPAPVIISKSIDDLKVGPIALEKTKGSSLVYAVGVLRNDSSHQRFGVNIELELTDARGNKAGTAKDYRAVLEPRQEWRFRALVLDGKAVSARVAAIREEE